MCGWTEGDDPIAEHLALSPDCGWAITTAIEAKVGNLHLDNPMSTKMVEARKATFLGRWPHEDKKGWKCKTKQVCYKQTKNNRVNSNASRWSRLAGDTSQTTMVMILPSVYTAHWHWMGGSLLTSHCA